VNVSLVWPLLCVHNVRFKCEARKSLIVRVPLLARRASAGERAFISAAVGFWSVRAPSVECEHKKA